MISRTPRYVRWSLFAVVAALPIAMITPWQAQAGPAPTVPARASRLPADRLTDRYLLQQIAGLRPANSIIVEEAPSSRGPSFGMSSKPASAYPVRIARP